MVAPLRMSLILLNTRVVGILTKFIECTVTLLLPFKPEQMLKRGRS